MRTGRRYLFQGGLIFILGIMAGYYWFNYPITVLAFAILLLSVIGLRLSRVVVMIFILLFLIAFTWMLGQEQCYRSRYSIANWNNQGTCTVTGEIVKRLASLTGEKVFLKPYRVNDRTVRYGLIQLNKNYLPAVRNGEIVTLKLNLEQPRRARNPGQFSYFNYLKKRYIYSLGYVSGKARFKGYRKYRLKEAILTIKTRMIKLCDLAFPPRLNLFIKALVLGEKDNLPREWDEKFSAAGASHLLAISGLHAGFVTLILFSCLQVAGIPELYKNIIISVFMVIYIIITGLRPSVLRAGLLTVIFIWGSCWERKGDILNICGLTVIITLIINPYLLFTAGFQLTYLVLLAIVFWAPFFNRILTGLPGVSAAAQLGSIPLTSYYFNLVTPVGIITNIWAIPLVAMIIMLALTGLLLGLIHPVFTLVSGLVMEPLFRLMMWGINMMVLVPGGNFEIPSPPIIFLPFFYLITFTLPVFLLPKYLPGGEQRRSNKLFCLILTILIVIIFILINPLFDDKLKMTFFSVGQGDSILIKTPGNGQILVDGGGGMSGDYNKGRLVVLPYLRRKGITGLNAIIVTHFDSDHARGILSILKERNVDLLLIPHNYTRNELAREIILLADRKGIPVKMVARGDSLQYGDVSLQILNPVRYSTDVRGDSNENSIVFRISYGNFSALLTGDLGKNGEISLIESGVELRSDLLKIAHHGSDDSSSYTFLRRVAPRVGIISVGRNNYGHPAQKVLTRMQDLGIKIYRTDYSGALTVITDGSEYKIKKFGQFK